jgi:hypothetical protein
MSALAAVAWLALVACAGDRVAPDATAEPARAASSPTAFDPAAPPASLALATARADAAIVELQRRLGGRLAAALVEGGPAGAVTVCRDEAPRLRTAVAREHGVELGRTSDRLRNHANGAPAWARETVAAAAGRPSAEVRPVAFDLGDRVGLLRPMVVAQACTRCHGTTETIPAEVAASLAREYPADRAVGYAAGDHRGFFWAEARK